MAHSIEKALKTYDRVVVVLGLGHCEYGYGVPERVDEESQIIITTRSKEEYDVDEDD